jgi:hypothetical protein
VYSYEDTAHGDSYCDGVNINTFGATLTYVDGYHDYVTNCGFSSNTPTVGVKFSLSTLNNDWFSGGGAALTDLSSCALTYAVNLHPRGNTGRWEIYADCNANGGGWFVLNYGYLGQGILTRPQHQGPVRLSTGITK